jgi:hypothetical protein
MGAMTERAHPLAVWLAAAVEAVQLCLDREDQREREDVPWKKVAGSGPRAVEDLVDDALGGRPAPRRTGTGRGALGEREALVMRSCSRPPPVDSSEENECETRSQPRRTA